MKGFYIEITNLLEPKHIKKIGSAIWEFLWCLDKMTSISEDGIGKVLGGKPIKWREIKKEIGKEESTISENMTRLSKEGYINLKRTPYGNIVTINKAKKRFKQETSENAISRKIKLKKREISAETSENAISDFGKRHIQTSEKPINKEDKAKYTRQEDIGDKIAIKFSLEEELKRLRDSTRKDYKIIAHYFKKKNWKFENREQFLTEFKRNLRPAKSLFGYSGEQIEKSIEYCIKNYPEIWTLETVSKRVAELTLKQ